MGGICGQILKGLDEKKAPRLFESMAEAMSFRGARQGFYSSGSAFLGKLGHDYEMAPAKVLENKKLGVVVVFEGEIYNADDLYSSLKNPPAKDGKLNAFELIPFLYRERGRDFPLDINGVFTMAVWDISSQELLLVRDHLGSHSLFYCHQHQSISFCSTIKGLFSLDHIHPEIEDNSLDRYFASLAVTPPDTMFRGVSAVRPGHLVVFHDGQQEEYAYWPLGQCTEEYGRSREEYAAQVRELFEDAVAIRAHGPGRFASLVSGGVDTSAVVAALFGRANISSLPGFSISFAEKDYSDAPLQQIMYDQYNIDPHQIILDSDDFVDGLVKGSQFLDSPVNDVAYAGMYKALQATAQHGCEVVFEGEGSDEIFCTGHSRGEMDIQKYLTLPKFVRQLLFGLFLKKFSEGATLSDKVVRKLARLAMSDLERRSTWVPVFSQKTRQRLLGRRVVPLAEILQTAREYYDNTQLHDPINIYQYGLTRLFLADDLLYKNERMAAAVGVMNRTPFIDYRLVEAAFKIPAKYKIRAPQGEDDGTKLIFKEAARGLVPDPILDRKKSRGFSQPTAIWYHGKLKDFVISSLLSSDAKIISYLDAKEVRRICLDFMEGRVSNDYFVNSLLILELWMQNHG